jgi:hypothetical protein
MVVYRDKYGSTWLGFIESLIPPLAVSVYPEPASKIIIKKRRVSNK